jgi:hypothetical protein
LNPIENETIQKNIDSVIPLRMKSVQKLQLEIALFLASLTKYVASRLPARCRIGWLDPIVLSDR